MKTKINIKKVTKDKNVSYRYYINNSINKFYYFNNTNSNYISSRDLLKNDLKKSHKTTFIQKTFINDYNSKENKEKILKISRKNAPFKNNSKEIKENSESEIKKDKFHLRLNKNIKSNLRNCNLNKIDINDKKINKYSNIFYLTNNKEEKNKKVIKNLHVNTNELYENNSSRGPYSEFKNIYSNYKNSCKNNSNKKNKFLINISKNNVKDKKNKNYFSITIKNDINYFKTIEKKENKNHKKVKLSITDTKLIISPKKGNNINNYKKKKINIIKKIKNNKDSSSCINMSDKELKKLSKKRTFIEKDESLKYSKFMTSKNTTSEENENKNNQYYPSFIQSYRKPIAKYNTNRRKIIIKENKRTIKGNYSNLNLRKHSLKNKTVLELSNIKKEGITLENSLNRNKNEENKNIIKKNLKFKKDKTYINDKILNSERNSRYMDNFHFKEIKNDNKILNIIKLNKKKTENNIKNKVNFISQKEEKKNDNTNDEEFNCVLNIESEHKNEINFIKTNNFDVNKPKEINMKYTLLKDLEDDEEEKKEINKSKIENIIIGEIEGYKVIIESDKINNKFLSRSKSSFDIKKEKSNKFIKNTNNKKFNKKIKNIKNFSNQKTSVKNIHILEDNSSEIEDLEFEINDNGINDQFVNIGNEYEFEDMTTYENDSNINKVNKLLPFQESKISFCKYYDKNGTRYITHENIDTDITSLIQLNTELNKLDYNYDKKNKKRIILNNCNNLKRKNFKYNKILNCYKHYILKKSNNNFLKIKILQNKNNNKKKVNNNILDNIKKCRICDRKKNILNLNKNSVINVKRYNNNLKDEKIKC